MIRLIKRRLAIRSYVWKLSQELLYRFGKKRYYSIENVTQAVQRSALSSVFLAYAHAIFCSRPDFDAHYEPLRVACTYDGLRSAVSRRYFGGLRNFDAASIVRATRRVDESDFHESGAGFPGAFVR